MTRAMILQLCVCVCLSLMMMSQLQPVSAPLALFSVKRWLIRECDNKCQRSIGGRLGKCTCMHSQAAAGSWCQESTCLNVL
jgi:hypothetical protein